MSDQAQPEWMNGFQPKPAPTKWERGMASPNPLGRPRGTLDKRTKVTRALMDDAPAVARVVLDAALEGDMQAASLVLSRCAPALRSQTECVQFEFDADASQTQQIAQVLAAIASGTVAPDVGKQIIDALGTLASARATDELEARLAALEAKAA